MARVRALRAAYERIEATPPLLRPIVAVYDAIEIPKGDKGTVLRTALDAHVPQVIISTASATYGLAGLVLGSFFAEAVLSLFSSLTRWRASRSRVVG